MPVEVRGVDNLKRALRKYDPDLFKAMNKEIGTALKSVSNEAKRDVKQDFISGAMDTGAERVSRTSRSRAFPVYNSSVIRKGLTYTLARKKKNRSGFTAAYSLLNKSAMGAIVETAGRKHPNGDPESQSNNPRAGAQFIQELNQEYGGLKQVGKGAKQRGRLMYKALDDNQGKARDAILKAIEDATKQFKAVTK
jgi:uncharacterized protein with von Willebrand factor type A (vWA) domain